MERQNTMATYSQELKDSLVSKMLTQNTSAAELARETGISINTLYRWRDKARKEKALAEAAALLVLRKNADAIWGDSEDE